MALVERQDRSGLGRLWPVCRPGLFLSWVVRGQLRSEKRSEKVCPACLCRVAALLARGNRVMGRLVSQTAMGFAALK